jgi:homoserine kinase type II
MAPFTSLSAADAAVIADAFGIGAVQRCRPIPAGTINSNFALVTATGRWFLRINEGKDEADVRYEAELVAELQVRGVATPVPRTGRTGRPYVVHRDHYVSLFPWVEGRHREAAEVGSADAEAVGVALARLHRAGDGLAERFARAGIYTFELIAERYRGFAASADPALAPAIAAIGDEIGWQAQQRSAREAAPHGIIHGDLFRDNVLFDAAGQATLIDFEQASVGSLVYDLAVCVNAWCYHRDFDLALAAAMVRGYQRERPLGAAEVAALPGELRRAAMRFTVTRITDVYLRGTHQPGKDFGRYLHRLERWRAFDAADLRARLGLG